MSFFEKRYSVNGWKGDKHSLTAKQLFERVQEDSKSDYNWITSATELIRVCNEPYFPEMYAQGIKLIILNCFANLELQKEYTSGGESTDKVAVYSCYHSLPSTDETVIKVKQKYLTAIITAITEYTECEVRLPMHPGPTYKKICEEWKKAKFDEYVSKEEIDFEQLREELYADFEKTIKTAEEQGAFKEDDEEYHEQIRKFLASIDLKEMDFYI
ncbi:MAG: hypothetical protein IJE05_07170 [Clostridia bacterium]|nr:hypothetical protein [Clostridia bacterium]